MLDKNDLNRHNNSIFKRKNGVGKKEENAKMELLGETYESNR